MTSSLKRDVVVNSRENENHDVVEEASRLPVCDVVNTSSRRHDYPFVTSRLKLSDGRHVLHVPYIHSIFYWLPDGTCDAIVVSSLFLKIFDIKERERERERERE